MTRRALAILVAAPLLWALLPTGAASAQQAPPPTPDPIQIILGVMSPFTTFPCTVVGLGGQAVPPGTPGYAQAFSVCAQFPVPAQSTTCSADSQLAGAAPLPITPPKPVGEAVESVNAAQQGVPAATGQAPPDVAGQLGSALQCTPGTPSSGGAPPAPPQPSDQSSPATPDVAGLSLGETTSGASAPLATSTESGAQPELSAQTPANAASAPAQRVGAFRNAATSKGSGGGFNFAFLLIPLLALGGGSWLFAGSGASAATQSPSD
ncbi:MAG: hypothetical protein JO086_00820 [Acidimicrobiia bacterium]|nr:hypothetical protein [Acidimicrobiia bacterium]